MTYAEFAQSVGAANDERPPAPRNQRGRFEPRTSGPIVRSPAGWVYFIQCAPPVGPVKIGWSKSLEQRLSQLRMCNPYPLLLCLATPGGRDLEEALHVRFSKQRIHGEWFTFLGPVLNHINEQARDPKSERFAHDEHTNTIRGVRFARVP